MNIFRIKFLIVSIFLSFSLFSQITSEVIILSENASGQDAMVGSSGLLDVNFGTEPYLNVYHDQDVTPIIARSFVQFDLTHIPTNAIIISAELVLTPMFISNEQSFNYNVRRVDSIWLEGTINWRIQNDEFISDGIRIESPNSSSTLTHSINVDKHVQNMVNYPYNNHGWKISLDNETLVGDYGVSFYSSNYTDASKRPKLSISYVLPIEIDVEVSHCTPGNDDGTVDITINGGSGNYSNYGLYRMYENPEVLAQQVSARVSSGTISGNLISVENLEPSLYMIRVSNPDYSGYKYLHFMVGREGETTDGIISHSAYVDQTKININLGASASTNDYANTAHGPGTSALFVGTTGTYSYGGSNAYHTSGLLDFNLYVDSGLDIIKADLHVKAHYYLQLTSNSNEVKYSPITSDWNQYDVTWNSRPIIDDNHKLVMPPSPNPNGHYNGMETFSIIPLMKYWQTNPNHGFEISLTNNEYVSAAFRAHRKIGNGSYFRFSYTVKSRLTPTFDEASNKGTIVVDAPEGELPYTYLISYAPIPDLETIWNGIKDSINIDSTLFFRGKENSKSHTFDELEAEKYYVAVFDNTGNQILEESTIVTTQLEFLRISDNILNVEDVVSLDPNSNYDGRIVLDGYLPKDKGGSVTLTIEALGDALIGFSKLDDTTALIIDDYIFCAKINSTGSIDIYKRGVIVKNFLIRVGDEITLKKNGSNFSVFEGDNLKHKENISNSFYNDLKTELTFVKGTYLIALKIERYIKYPPKPIRHNYNSEISCGTNEGRFHWNLFSYYNVNPNSITVNGVEIGTGVSFSGLGAFGAVSVGEGVYVVTISWQLIGGSAIYSEVFQFRAGNTVHWNYLNNMNYSSFQGANSANSISADSWSSGIIGTSASSNVLEEGEDGWLSFNVKTYEKSEQISHNSFGSVSMKNLNNIEAINCLVLK